MHDSADVVVIGAGIVGTSAAHHLARLGCSDVLVVDQGPLPATGGSSSHAPGLVFQTNPSRTMTRLAASTVAQLGALELDGRPCFHRVGGIEVARTQARWADLHRKLGLARSWGVRGAALLTPQEVARRVPELDPERILGGFAVPSDGIAEPVRAMAAMVRAARRAGVRITGGVEVTGFDVAGGRVRAVRTTAGTVAAGAVVCCAGIWGPRVGRLAGVSVPVQPLAHQYAVSTPVLPAADATVVRPILRDQDRRMYLRQVHDRFGLGSYQHDPIPVAPDAIARTSAPGTGGAGAGGWAGMASVQPFTAPEFKQAWEDARELLPALGRATVAEGMNGLFLFTADGMPVLGPSAELENFWLGEAVWITHGPGVGLALAEWLVHGRPEIDLRAADARRFERFAHTPAYVGARAAQSFREVYDVIHPQAPPRAPRGLRTSPFHGRQQALGAVFLEGGGWERPQWYAANTGEVAGRDLPEPGEWAGRYAPAVVGAEHQITRERVAMFDMTPLTRVEVPGPGAPALLQRLCTGRLDRDPGYVTYTLMLDDTGGVRSDVTVARLGPERFQVGVNGPRDVAWMRAHAGETADVRDVTGGTCCVGLWGPRAADVLSGLVSTAPPRRFRAAELVVGEVPVTALGLSYVGEPGWELYTSAEFGLRLWDLLAAAGARHGVIAAGRGALNGLRLECGYRAWGVDVCSEDDPDEAGLGFAVTGAGFLGAEALARRRTRRPARLLRGLTANGGTVVLGSEPVLHPDRGPVGFVTSAAYGYSVRRSLALAWLPADLAAPGTRLEIEYFGRRHPATVDPS